MKPESQWDVWDYVAHNRIPPQAAAPGEETFGDYLAAHPGESLPQFLAKHGEQPSMKTLTWRRALGPLLVLGLWVYGAATGNHDALVAGFGALGGVLLTWPTD